MGVSVRKYNPWFLSDDEAVASFCIRKQEFASIIETLRECVGNSNPHRIVIGPRGSGKTSLLRRVSVEMRPDAELSSRFFPVAFSEESYEVSSAGEFWLECLSRLADQAPHRAGGPDLHLSYDELRAVRDDKMLEDRCLGVLLDFADREGKRLVLMVENLNAMFRDMTDANGAGWRLRKILQTEPRIVLLASATSRFEQIDNPQQALYDLLQVLTLGPLDTEECAVLWQAVSGQDSRSKETIRSLEILTGGNPRLLMIVARFGADLSFRKLMDQLYDLVDDNTEYFKSHLESLPAQERRVYLALANLWKPATTKEIADRARLDTSLCSAHLARLIERGSAQVVGGTARRKQYYLTERMYNIYYLLRRSRGPDRLVNALVRFMESYYSPSGLRDIAAKIASATESLEGEMRTMHQTAFAQLLASPVLAERRGELLATIPAGFLNALDWSLTPSSGMDSERVGVKPAVGQVDQTHGDADASAKMTARDLTEKLETLRKQGRPEEVLATCDEMARRFGDSEVLSVQVTVAKALTDKVTALYKLNRLEEALAASDEVAHRFMGSEAPAIQERVAQALANKASMLGMSNRFEEALAASDEVARRFGGSEAPAIQEAVAKAFVNKAAVLGMSNRLEEALAASDEVARRFGGSEAPAVQEGVAQALANKASMLGMSNRFEEALAASDEVARRFGGSEAPAVQEAVAKALADRVTTLGMLHRPEEALAASDEVARRFGGSEVPAVQEAVAKAFANKASMLGMSNRFEEVLAASDEMARRFEDSEVLSVQVTVAKALADKVTALYKLNRLEEALAASDEVARRFMGSEAPAIQEGVAQALANKAAMLGMSNRFEEALAASDEMARRFGGSEAPAVQDAVAKALADRVTTLGMLHRPEEALVASDEVARRFGGSEAPAVQGAVAKAFVNKAAVLGMSNRFEEALAASDEMARRFGGSEAPAVQDGVAQALANKAAMLGMSNRFEEALAASDEVARRFGGSEAPAIQESVAKALADRVTTLGMLHRPEEALAASDEVARRFGGSEAPAIQEAVAKAFVNKAAVLGMSNRFEEALAASDEMARRFGDSEVLSVQVTVAKALADKAAMLGMLHQPEETLAAFDEVVRRFGGSKNPALLDAVATTLLNKGTAPGALRRPEETLAVFDEMARRIKDGALHESPALAELALLEKAHFELGCRRHETAIETAGQALERCAEGSRENRLRGHLIRARATLANGTPSRCEPDIERMLAILPELDSSPKESLDALLEFSVGLGPARVLGLIRSSPSADILLPLTTALEQELGGEPRVAQEVEDVARDIRKNLSDLSNANSARH